MITRKCFACKKKKPLTEFVKCNEKRNGKFRVPYRRGYQCILCNREACRSYHRRPEIKKRYKEYYLKHRSLLHSRYLCGIWSAKKRNLPFTLTYKQYTELVRTAKCHYCYNSLPTYGVGLDRINGSRGYSINNIIPCCTSCNMIRGKNLTMKEMEVAMKAVLNLRKNG